MTIRALHYDANGIDREVVLAADAEFHIDPDQLLWIDLDVRNPDDLRRAAAAVGLEPEGLSRLSRVDRRSRILRLPDRLVLTLGAVDADDPEAIRRELDIVIGANHVITVHDEPLTAINAFREEIDLENKVGDLDAATFVGGLIDTVHTAYFRQIESIERDIDELDEQAVLARGDEHFLASVLVLRRRIARLRRALAPNREALLPLERPDVDRLTDFGSIWPGTIQRLERAIDGVENARELLVGSFDLYLGRASQRANDVMKALTVVSAIALPAVVLAGVMGMNFQPSFFDQPDNFYVVVGAMVVFAIAILAVARWRRWI